MGELTDEIEIKARNPWPARIGAVFAVVSLVCCVGGWLMFREPDTEENRLLVAIHLEEQDGTKHVWWSSEGWTPGAKVAARLHDAVVKGFDQVDLEVVSRETPRALEALAGADTVAAQKKTAAGLGAAWLLTGAVKATSATPIADTEWTEYTFDAELSLVPTTGGGEAIALPTPVRFRARGGDALNAMSRVVSDVAKLATPPALDVLSEQARMQHYADPEGLSVEEQIMADQLRRFFRYASDRREALAAHAEREAGGADIERARGLDPDKRIGPWLGWEVVLGAGPEGTMVLKVDELRPELPIGERTVELVEVHETVVVAKDDGTERKRLFDTYNFYGWPRVSDDGRWVTGVVDERGLALTLVAISVPDGEVVRVRAHAEHEFSTPLVDPAGERVVYWWQPCRGCTMELRVVGLRGGEPKTLMPNVEGSGGNPTWMPDGSAVVVSVDPPGRPGSVWSVDVESGERTLIAGPGDTLRGDGFHYARVAPDGSYVAAIETDTRGDQHLTVIDLESGERDRLYHGELSRLDISPDSTKIAFRYRPPDTWDWEIGVLEAASGAMDPVTRALRSDSIGGWNRGSDVLYTMQHERGETDFYRIYANSL